MRTTGTSMKNYKALIMMLILVFSLSPCSVKRDLLGIFDVQYISGLNKVKTTANPTFDCDSSTELSSRRMAASKADFRSKETTLFTSNSGSDFPEDTVFQKKYSGTTTGNSPPKYILFKRLKLHVV
ncbi:hypothetical protein SAMN05421594_0791 [Chryseobacterium oleae]|uniref:Uncharacterized protein n=1 Tax=Chryseobacterium oleae TaxID=491207 RepID=A0A1I4W0A9_CHROL|nr:hypothetical protein [Chryseobacterium oleae]SFN06951.1 hypothetical protein SAMN05421594_0791 [Chryseobacterium oleae]